jgi:serine/threonine protein kinase
LAHLNLQPANLKRRQQDGKLVLIDFDILGDQTTLPQREQFSSFEQTRLQEMPGYQPPEGLVERSEISRDLYAVGMIGIQALTGIHPNYLTVDRKTGEIIWRFTISDRPMVPVSEGLARILTKLVRHSPDQRYLSAAEVLEDLDALQPAAPERRLAWFSNRRILVGGLTTLALLSGVGIWSYAKTLQTNQMNACNASISLEQSDVERVVSANRVLEACNQVIARQPNNQQALKHRGQALVLLWKQESTDPENLLNRAADDFTAATKIRSDDPQAFFLLGLVQSLQNNPAYSAAYRQAIDLYLEQNSTSADDLPTLAALLTFLLKQPLTQATYEQTDALFGKAESVSPTPANLIYNRGAFNVKAGNYRDAIRIFRRSIATGESAETQSQNQRAWLSQAFAALLLGQSGWQDALDAFRQAIQIKSEPVALTYKAKLEACLASANRQSTAKSSCELTHLTAADLGNTFQTIFPTLPIYSCQQYPVLAVAQKKDDRTLCQ